MKMLTCSKVRLQIPKNVQGVWKMFMVVRENGHGFEKKSLWIWKNIRGLNKYAYISPIIIFVNLRNKLLDLYKIKNSSC